MVCLDPRRIAQFDGASVPELMRFLHSDNPHDRADAACAVGDRVRSREQTDVDAALQERLATLLDDPDATVRFEAAVALAELRDTRATSLLLHAMARKALRLDAIRALGALGDRRAVPSLARLMRRFLMPWADRLQAAAALCALGDAAGAAYLETKLRSRKHAERAAAIHFIGECRHPQALPLLLEILRRPADPMLDVAVRALGLLEREESRPFLETLLKGASDDLAEDIRAALARLPGVAQDAGVKDEDST